MMITSDPVKRDRTLCERELDFTDAAVVFGGPTITFEDDRLDYPEVRFVTVGVWPIGWLCWYEPMIGTTRMRNAGGLIR